jgi:hypothetical protein
MAVMPGAKWEPVPSHSGLMNAHLGLCLHVQVGDGDCYGEFSNPANQASSTWWVAKDGTLVQYVDADLMAWTQAAGNGTWNGVETEGYPNEPLTQAQILTLGRLYAWGHQLYSWPLVTSESPSIPGFIWHGAGGVSWGNHPSCPGDIRKAQRDAVLYIAFLTLNPPAPAPPAPVKPPYVIGDNMHVVPVSFTTDAAGWTATACTLPNGATPKNVVSVVCDWASAYDPQSWQFCVGSVDYNGGGPGVARLVFKSSNPNTFFTARVFVAV